MLPETLLLPLQTKIQPEDLHEYGLSKDPHTTLLFGLKDEEIDKSEVEKIISEINPFNITIHNLSVFENEEYDVLKFDATSPELNLFNKKLRELPHENDHPDYHAHCTVGYLKSGKGAYYVKNNQYPPFQALPTKIKYTRVINNKPEFNYYDFDR